MENRHFFSGVLNRMVSYYPNKNTPNGGVDMSLLTILNSQKHKERILEVRDCTDETIQKVLKLKLPCYTVAGTFSGRNNNGLVLPSGLCCVDLDSAENYDVLYLLQELKKVDSIAYAGLSCRGQRLYCIVPLLYPDKYMLQYDRLIQSFVEMGLPMGDTCHKTISQPRFISWNDDSTQFFNHKAKPYHLLPAEKTYHVINPVSAIGNKDKPDNPFGWCCTQINKSHSFVDGNMHNYLIQLARYCNMKGLSEEDTLIGCCTFIQNDADEWKIISLVRHVYKKHADSHNKYPFVKNQASNPPKVQL